FKQAAATNTSLFQMIVGMRDIRLATAERAKRTQWERLQSRQFQLTFAGIALAQHLQAGAMAIHELKNIVITIVTALEVIHGRMTLGTMLAISYMLGVLGSPIDQLLGIFQSAQDAKISVDRIGEI